MREREDMVLQNLNRPFGRQRRNDGVISSENGRPNERRHIKLPGLSTLAKIGGFVAAPFTGGASIPIGLGIGGALDAGSQQGKANEASQQALDFARQDVTARQPFRDQLFASLQQGQPQREDLGSLFQSANPFAQTLGPLNPAQPQTMAPVGGGGFLGNTVQDFLAKRGLGGLGVEELRARGVTGGIVDRRRGGSASFTGRGRAPFLEDEERFSGRFEREF